jgi:hypothetical protein
MVFFRMVANGAWWWEKARADHVVHQSVAGCGVAQLTARAAYRTIFDARWFAI